jgi:hypothetical protein
MSDAPPFADVPPALVAPPEPVEVLGARAHAPATADRASTMTAKNSRSQIPEGTDACRGRTSGMTKERKMSGPRTAGIHQG